MAKVNIFLKSGQRVAVEMNDKQFINLAENIGSGDLIFYEDDYAITLSEVAMMVKLEPERDKGC